MIAGAIQQALAAAGLDPVRVGKLGDYVPGATPVWAVNDEPGADTAYMAESGRPYETRVQVRCRAETAVAAVLGCEQAFALVEAMHSDVLTWAAPEGDERQYRINMIRVVTRPGWFPSPDPNKGAVASGNLRMRVTRL